MTLVELRQKFAEMSGRYDLVVDTTDWADNGADFYIKAAQRFLEKRVNVPENTAWYYEALAAGEYKISFQQHCRGINKVFAEDANERWELKRLSLVDFKNYYNEPAADITQGSPEFYTIAQLRAVETTDKDSLATYLDNTHAEGDTNYDYRGLIIGPPCDQAYVISISGLFGQKILDADSDENWWTLEAPEVLLKGALYELEAFSRGTEDRRNFIRSIDHDLFGIEKDTAFEESADIDNMEG